MRIMNGYDAILMARFLVKDPDFVPNIYQLIAMDVNMDGAVTAGDISQLQQRSVSMIGEFKQVWNNNDTAKRSLDWIFINDSLLTAPPYQISTAFPLSDGSPSC